MQASRSTSRSTVLTQEELNWLRTRPERSQSSSNEGTIVEEPISPSRSQECRPGPSPSTTCLAAAAAGFSLLLLLLDKHRFIDIIICLLFFIPYPFWFSRIAVLVPLVGSPPLQTKILVILLLTALHLISRCELPPLRMMEEDEEDEE